MVFHNFSVAIFFLVFCLVFVVLRLVLKVSFLVAIYRNNTQLIGGFIGTDTANVELCFNMFNSGIETVVLL